MQLQEKLNDKILEYDDLEYKYDQLIETLCQTQQELQIHANINLEYRKLEDLKLKSQPVHDKNEIEDLERIEEQLKEHERERKRLQETISTKTEQLTEVLNELVQIKRKLNLPESATTDDMLEKIDDLVTLEGATEEKTKLMSKIAELRKAQAELQRSVKESERQQKWIDFETRNLAAKNTRLTGRRKVQSFYVSGNRRGMQHQFVVLPEESDSQSSTRGNTQLPKMFKEVGKEGTKLDVRQKSTCASSGIKDKKSSYGGTAREFLAFYCVFCRKSITNKSMASSPCILHCQSPRNMVFQCCNSRIGSPGCCSVQHCFIYKDLMYSNIYIKTGDGRHSMVIHK